MQVGGANTCDSHRTCYFMRRDADLVGFDEKVGRSRESRTAKIIGDEYFGRASWGCTHGAKYG